MKKCLILFILVMCGTGIFADSGLRRGMNLGNALEAPDEGAWGVTIKPEYMKIIKEAGFDFVRVPVRWDIHAEDVPPYAIRKDFMDRVTEVVNEAYKNNLKVLINVHHFENIMKEPDNNKDKLDGLWKQIANNFKSYDNNLYFEILNEPNKNMTSDKLNLIYQRVIKTIRNISPDRKIALGGINWSNFVSTELTFVPENDKNIILLFNYYNPFQFTHQSADWVEGSYDWAGTKWKGDTYEREQIAREFDIAVNAAKKKNVDLMIGEFGAYSSADMKSRARWTDCVAREAEKRGIAWTYWEFCSGFGAYEPFFNSWRMDLLNALIK